MKKANMVVDRINQIATPWSELGPELKLGGVTLSEFKTAVAACADKRQELATLKARINAAVSERLAADLAARKLMRRVVAGVVADPTLGSESAIYRAMKFVPDNERGSNSQSKQSSTTAAVPTASSVVPSTK